MGHPWSKATSCESRTVSCVPHPPTFSHLTIDKSRWQVHTAVDHARYEVTAQPRLHTSTHRTHSHTCINTSPAELDIETCKLDTAVRSALSSDGTWRFTVLFRQMSVALAWERGCSCASSLCKPVRTGFNRRTNPRHPLDLQSSRQVLQSLRSARTGILRTRRVYDNAMSYTNCTISFHNEATYMTSSLETKITDQHHLLPLYISVSLLYSIHHASPSTWTGPSILSTGPEAEVL